MPTYLGQSLHPWSSFVEGGEASYLPNCQTTLVIALDALSLLFCIFINTTSYHLGRYEPSPPSTKELHAVGQKGLIYAIWDLTLNWYLCFDHLFDYATPTIF